VYPPGQTPLAHPRLVDWRYLQTMRIPLVAGRFFSARDTAESEKAIIVNEKLAKRLWPNQDPVGQIVLMAGEQRVVGVVGNVRHQSLEEEGGLEAYMPITQVPSGSVELVVRTRLPLEALAGPLRAALRGVDATLPTAEYQKLGELVERAVSPRRFLMLLLGAFAAAALALASIGIYGVVSYSVSRRTAEIGVRMALGASPRQVRRQVIRETAGLVGCGVAAGIAGALALGRLMGSLLYRMEPADPVIYGLAVAALAGVALAAAYVPALRASRVDPMAALRTT
jgi:predicted permease